MRNSSRSIKIYIVLSVLPLFTLGQNKWAVLGGVVPNRYVTSLCSDSVRNQLYVGGDFKYVNQQDYPGIFQWDGNMIKPMGCGVGHCGGITCGGVRSMLMHQGNLVALFPSDSMDCRLSYSIAEWDGLQWLIYNQQFFDNGYNVFPTAVFSFDSILVVNGSIDSIQGRLTHGQVKYNGATWDDFLYCPLFSDDRLGKPSIIQFKGDFYAFSIENDTLGQHQNFVKWNGSCWEKVPNVFNSFDMAIHKMIIYKGDLYVAGSFSSYSNASFPGNNIAKFDGQVWDNMDGGIDGRYPGIIASVEDMIVHDDYLYVVGSFYFAGGIPARNIARWDGSRWCTFGSVFDNTITSIAFFHDSLFIGGGFHTIDGDSMEFIVKWIGGNFVDSCTAANSVAEPEQNGSIALFPNPVQSTLTVNSKREVLKSISIFSPLGEELSVKENIKSFEAIVVVDQFSNGLYFICIETESGSQFCKKFIKN